MAKRYSNCPTCGGICEQFPPFPKPHVHLVAMQDRELRRLVDDLQEQLQRWEKRAEAATPNEFIETFTSDELMQEIKRRCGIPTPIRWSDLQG